LPNRYLAFNKPYGVISQFSGSDATRTLRHYIPVQRVYPVGRLDQDSEGLLLLTDDGGLQHRLTDPKFAHPRTYWVQVERIPDENALRQLREGVMVQNYRTLPAQLKLLNEEPQLPRRDPPIRFRKSVPTAWLEITLVEGRNRQVRRMTAAIGHATLRLVRVAIGDLWLQGLRLEPGEWRELSNSELKALRPRM
jgi:23S rRNA pseudouridine2457 synthase